MSTQQQQPQPSQPHSRRSSISAAADDEPNRRPTRSEKGKTHLKKPEVFNGNKADFEDWWEDVEMYIADRRSDLDDKEDKICFVLSYMNGPNLKLWKRNFVKTYKKEYDEEDDDDVAFYYDITFKKFIRLLKERFTDVNQKMMAQAKLEALKQGLDSAEDFFNVFESLVTEADYDLDDEYTIRLVKKSVNEKIIDRIYEAEELPEDYAAWRKKIIRFDTQMKVRNEEKKNMGLWRPKEAPGPSKPQAQNQAAPAAPPKQSNISGDRKDSTGTTFGGRGKPMDLDKAKSEGLCFRCGTKGHISRNCPTRSKEYQVRQLWAQMSKEEQSTLTKDFLTADQEKQV
jgi:hypothetical protein